MATTLQFRRGNTATAAAVTGLVGELYIDTDKKTIRVHDGVTAGGNLLISAADTSTVTNTMLAGSIANNKLSNSAITINSASTSLGGSVTLYAGTTTLQTASATQSLTGIELISTGAAAPTVASSATIAPTTRIVFVSGTTAINTITAPAGISTTGGQITLIPTGLWSTTTSGNIALVTTAVVNKALIMTYDSGTSKWYPSY